MYECAGDRKIRRIFDSASALNENLYDNDMDGAAVTESLDDVETLLAKVDPLLTQT